ncbi:PLP-dependent transferase [Mycena floridula]|nr:PLP-dependent transferase [Mycena floridula]
MDIPQFGHAMLKYFTMDPESTNLNNGSYGTTPKPVQDACTELGLLVETNPDLFCRFTYPSMLVTVRKRLADFLKVPDIDEIVMVPNASHGLNTVLWNFLFEEGDVLIRCNTTYNSIFRTAQYLADINAGLILADFTILFPTSHQQIIEDWRAHLKALNQNRKNSATKIVAVVDSIISNPGVCLPWKEMVKICKEENVWSVVDAAHSIGQEQNLDLPGSGADFWVSNCHKWLSAKRACAVLYVPKKNQKQIISSFPTSHAYVSPALRTSPDFVAQFEWNGTQDFVPCLSVSAALDWRNSLGGEAVIDEYCRNLALQGGKRLAEILGTELMDKTGEFTLHMVNVALPLSSDLPLDRIDILFKTKMVVEQKCFAASFYHNERWWARCSAQIWNEISDFERLGRAYKICIAEIEAESSQSTVVSTL